MRVLLISPGYPGEMPHFARGLARVGAEVIGLGDQPRQALPADVRPALKAYLQVPELLTDEITAAERVAHEVRAVRIDRVECLWEPGMLLAARLRERLGVAGLTRERTIPFRDKEKMKQVLDAAGIRTPRHASATSAAAVRTAADRIGYPLIVKPVAGGGSADTYRIDSVHELEAVLPRLHHVAEVSVEEFIDGEEFTHDTICAGGEILFENIAWYRPRPLDEKKHEWLSPQTISLRRVDAPELAAGREMGHAVLRALRYETGFTHMEWFRKPDGEVVFGEIGARPPGARMVDIMNYSCDLDLFTGWAEAVCHGQLSQPVIRRYNAAMISKRARGQGRIARIDGLERLRAELGDALVCVELLPVGSRRRNWRSTSIGDGFVIVRHPELQTTLQMADRVGRELQLFAA